MESEREITDLQPENPNPGRSQPINLNHYATKKSVAESMLDVALFMSNAMRLKTVLEQGPSSQYYATLITLISISLLLQVVIGILLVVIARLNLNEVEKQWQLNQLNNAATILVFITVVINVFITALGHIRQGSWLPGPQGILSEFSLEPRYWIWSCFRLSSLICQADEHFPWEVLKEQCRCLLPTIAPE